MLTYREKVDVESNLLVLNASPNLYLSIRNLLLDEVTRQVEGDMPTVKELAKGIREEIEIHSATTRAPFKEVAGVDAGRPILPLGEAFLPGARVLLFPVPP